MSNIVRDSEVVELDAPPYFTFGEKVLAKRTVRNDGTYAGKEIGEMFGVMKQAISIQAKGMLAHIDKRRAMSAGIPDTLTPAAFDAKVGKSFRRTKDKRK